MIPHAAHFAPRLRPGFVKRGAGRVPEAQAVPQGWRAPELEAQQGGREQWAAAPLHAVIEPPLANVDADLIPSVRRGDADLCLRPPGAGGDSE